MEMGSFMMNDETSPGVVRAAGEAFLGRVQLFKTPQKNTSMAKVIII